MEQFIQILEKITLIIDTFSVIVLVWGVILCAIDFFVLRFRAKKQGGQREDLTLPSIKNRLGAYVLLSLEILIAADIIDTIANPTSSDIFQLASIVVIRTVISYFLNKEIQDTKEMAEMAKEKK